MPTTDDLLTTGQAARRLQVSIYTIRRWAKAGKLPVQWTPMGHRRFLASDLDAAFTAEPTEATA